MHYAKRTLEELIKKIGLVGERKALVGVDGFVDKIMTPVEQRSGQGDNFKPFDGMAAFGQRIVDAAGKSCNIELYPRMEKLGGNGPLMADALHAAGLSTRYIGALGDPVIHPVFENFARRTRAVSIAEPGVTHALEFDDGKIMLGSMSSLDNVTYEQIIARMGEGPFIDALSRADLVALVNWTMIPNMTALFGALLERVLPHLPPHEAGRVFLFFKGEKPKRCHSARLAVHNGKYRFRSFGHVTLGLNLAEAQQVSEVLGLPTVTNDEENLRRAARAIRQKLSLSTVVVHPRDCAACANKDGEWFTFGPVTEKSHITTGAGDHFNAGFSVGQVLGLSPEACLTLAVCCSGQYVRSGRSPSLTETDAFLRSHCEQRQPSHI